MHAPDHAPLAGAVLYFPYVVQLHADGVRRPRAFLDPVSSEIAPGLSPNEEVALAVDHLDVVTRPVPAHSRPGR